MGISLKELKKNRLSPAEKWVLETIDGVKPKTHPSGDVEWRKDSKELFIQYLKKGILWVNYINVRLVLKKEFGLNRDEIKDLLTNLLYDYTDNGKLKVNFF